MPYAIASAQEPSPGVWTRDWEECDLGDWIRLIKSEYLEMPGLHLTSRQVERLCGLTSDSSAIVLAALEAARFLRRTESGAYVRADATV